MREADTHVQAPPALERVLQGAALRQNMDRDVRKSSVCARQRPPKVPRRSFGGDDGEAQRILLEERVRVLEKRMRPDEVELVDCIVAHRLDIPLAKCRRKE